MVFAVPVVCLALAAYAGRIPSTPREKKTRKVLWRASKKMVIITTEINPISHHRTPCPMNRNSECGMPFSRQMSAYTYALLRGVRFIVR